MPRAAVEPVRVKVHDPDLGCERLRIVGYRMRCLEHGAGATRDTWGEAVVDALEHNRSEHAP